MGLGSGFPFTRRGSNPKLIQAKQWGKQTRSRAAIWLVSRSTERIPKVQFSGTLSGDQFHVLLFPSFPGSYTISWSLKGHQSKTNHFRGPTPQNFHPRRCRTVELRPNPTPGFRVSLPGDSAPHARELTGELRLLVAGGRQASITGRLSGDAPSRGVGGGSWLFTGYDWDWDFPIYDLRSGLTKQKRVLSL